MDSTKDLASTSNVDNPMSSSQVSDFASGNEQNRRSPLTLSNTQDGGGRPHRDSGCFPELVSVAPSDGATVAYRDGHTSLLPDSMVSNLNTQSASLVAGRNATPPMDIPGTRSSSQSSSHSDYISFSASNPSSSLPCTTGTCPLSSPSARLHLYLPGDSQSSGDSEENSPEVFTGNAVPLFRRGRRRVHSECLVHDDVPASPPLSMRHRSNSMPAFLLHRQQELGRELRRIGDDFHQQVVSSTQSVAIPRRGHSFQRQPGEGGRLLQSQSYPGGEGERAEGGLWGWVQHTVRWVRGGRPRSMPSYFMERTLEEEEEQEDGQPPRAGELEGQQPDHSQDLGEMFEDMELDL